MSGTIPSWGHAKKEKKKLNEHIASVHEGKEPFKCNICNSSFTQEGQMNGHVALVHEGKKPFKCSICDTSFAEKSKSNEQIA